MNIRFMVPWRPDDGHRDKLWRFAQGWWARECPDITIVEGESPPGAFNRSAAINNAAKGDWDFGIVLDADVVAPGSQINAALAVAHVTDRVTFPFDIFLGLTPNMTARAISGDREHWERGCRYTSKIHESSIVVIPRGVWEETGGFDERFVGWGQEDVAFAHSARLLTGGLNRVAGAVWHLWHERSRDRNNLLDNYRSNQALGDRYREAVSRADMLALLAERNHERALAHV